MAKSYFTANGPSPTTAAQVPVTTGTTIKTMLQLATPATEDISVVEWGISFDGSAAAAPIRVELLETGAVAATVTAHAAAGLVKWSSPNDSGSLLTLGAAATGYTATAEGTITTSRMLDLQFISPTSQYVKQFPLGREPRMGSSRFLRIRVTAPAAVNCYCYIIWEE